ncbi:hypothetical protein GCM10020001_119190 [Nonomuraea salmonea]
MAAQVARPFQAAGRAIQTALETAVVRPGRLMAGLAVQAGRSAREIGSAFVESSRVAQSALNAINSVSFAPVVAKARAAGAMIGSAFSSATARAERALTPIQGILTKRVMKPVGYTVAGIAGIAAGIAGFGLVWAAELEQTTISFTALLGSAKAARDYVAELQQFAAETPFEFQGLADAAMRLLAMGKAAGIAKKEILPTLTIIGDIAAVLGQGQEEIDGVVRALGQMASKGKTSMEELHQISERLPGFSAVAAIAAARGTSTGQAMDDIAAGAVTGREGIDAILKGMQQFKGAAGAMEAQSETLAGRWSAFKDQLKIAMTDAIQPLVPTAKKALDQLGPVLAQGASALVPSLGTLLEAFTPFLSALVSSGAPVLAQLFGVLAKALQILTPLLGPVLGAFGQLLAALTPLMGPIGAIASLAGTILAAALRLLAAILTPIVSALSGPLTTAIAQLQPAFSQLAAAIMPVASQLAQQLAPILPQLIPPFLQLAVALIELLAAVMPILPPIIQLAGALLNLAVSKVVVPPAHVDRRRPDQAARRRHQRHRPDRQIRRLVGPGQSLERHHQLRLQHGLHPDQPRLSSRAAGRQHHQRHDPRRLQHGRLPDLHGEERRLLRAVGGQEPPVDLLAVAPVRARSRPQHDVGLDPRHRPQQQGRQDQRREGRQGRPEDRPHDGPEILRQDPHRRRPPARSPTRSSRSSPKSAKPSRGCAPRPTTG